MNTFEYIASSSELSTQDLAELGLLEEDSTNIDYIDDGGSGADSLFGTVSDGFAIGIPIFAILFVAVVIFIIVVATRNYRAAKKAGFDPMTMETDLMARAANSTLLASKKSLEDKLVELNDLQARGVITREEYMQARKDALGN